MYLEDVEHEIIIDDGKRYELIKLDKPFDLTEQNNGVHTEITHVLKGFDEDLYLIIEEDSFYFGYKVGDTGLVVNLEDQYVYDKAIELLMKILNKI